MNHVYTVIWNESKQCFVVANEKAGSCGRPSISSSSLAVAVSLALGTATLLTAPSTAFAGSCPSTGANTINANTSVACQLGDGDATDAVTVTNTGTINVAPGDAIVVTGGNAATSVTNEGTVSGAGNALLVEGTSSITSGLTNDGTLSGGVNGIRLITRSGLSGGFINRGRIDSAGGDAIYLFDRSSISGGLQNRGSGVISGASGGLVIESTSVLFGALTNGGTITAADDAVAVKSGSRINSNVTNSGLIQSAARGIELDSTSTIVGALINSGTISASDSAIAILNGSTISGQVSNSGLISGGENGILVNQATLSSGIFNSGTISISGATQGAIELVSGATVSGGISNTGTITAGASDSDGIALFSASTLSGGIDNAGLISASAEGLDLDDSSGITGGVTNSGTITAGGTGIEIDETTTVSGGITNSGTITAGEEGIEIDQTSTVSGGITNSGSIVSTGKDAIEIDEGSTVSGGLQNLTGGVIQGASTGLFMSSSSELSGGFVNQGAISGTKRGIQLESAATIAGGINNSGTISGGTGDGILLEGSAVVSGGITNSGRIESTGTDNAINIAGGSTVSDGLQNLTGGVIQGANTGVFMSSAGVLSGGLVNQGTISGSARGIQLESGATIAGGLNNSGTIGGGTGSGILLETSGVIDGGLTNSGLISGAIAAISARVSSVIDAIQNTGTVQSATTGVKVSGSTLSGDLNNSGLISGTGASGISLESNATISGAVINSGSVLGGGAAGIGVANSLVSGALTNSGTVQGATAGIKVSGGTLSSNLSNSGLISGTGGDGIALDSNATIGGALINSSSVIGSATGVSLSSSTISGGLTTSGTISGGTNAIAADSGSVLPNVDITGTSARIIGDVVAASTNVNVKSGAEFTMEGDFTVSAFTAESSSTLTIPTGQSRTVTGNFVQSASSTFQVGVTSTSNYGQLAVSGTATLPSSAKIDVDVAGVNSVASLDEFADVISAGTLTSDGTFMVTDNSALFDFTATLDGNTVDLTAQRLVTVVDSVTNTKNPAALGAAAVFDDLFDNGGGSSDMDTVLATLAGLSTDQEVSDAVSETLPLMTGGMNLALGNVTSGINGIVQARMESNLGISSGDDILTDRYFWAKPFGSWLDQDDRKNVSGYDGDAYGLVIGADGVMDQTRLGGAIAYSNSDFDSDSAEAPQSSDVDSWFLIGYGSHSLDEVTELNFQADVGFNDVEGVRQLPTYGRTARAGYDSLSMHVGGGISRTYPVRETMNFTASARVDYTRIESDGYTETGAGALNLVVKDDNTEALIWSVDGNLSYQPSDGVTFEANAGIGYDSINDRASVASSFVGGGGVFVTNGIDPEPWLGRIGLGVSKQASEGMTFSLNYDAEVREDFSNQTASVKVRYDF